ncbi:MAG: hypothetical protein RBT71_08110 [Flavobacteriales bacterium]|jgi:hypothetical protein|nr:hypothetical protein [Flavobacteriales bacterium]
MDLRGLRGGLVMLLMLAATLPGQAFHIVLGGVVTRHPSGEPLKGVQVRLVKDSVERETVVTGTNGRYELYLERGYDYQVWFHRSDLVTKYVRIDAREIPLRPDVPFFEMDLQMTMFPWIPDVDFSFFEQPVGLAQYKHSVRNLNWDVAYTQRRGTEMVRVMTAYDRAVVRRDKEARQQARDDRRRKRKGAQ